MQRTVANHTAYRRPPYSARGVVGMQGLQGRLLRAPAQRQAARPSLQYTARCMVSQQSRGGDDQDKSWGEIAGDAFQLAKTAFTKATKSVSDAAGRLIPRGEDPQEQARWRDDDRRLNQDPLSRSRPQSRSPYSRGSELYRPEDDSFLGGLMGRTAGTMLGGIFGQVDKMMAESSRNAADAKQRALSIIQGNKEVTAALGDGVSIMPGMDSQSTSTSIVNGRKTQMTSIGFLIAGRRGHTAQAQAEVTSRPDGQEDVRVTVRLPDGWLVRVGEPGGSRGAGTTIDVEWKEIR